MLNFAQLLFIASAALCGWEIELNIPVLGYLGSIGCKGHYSNSKPLKQNNLRRAMQI